MRTAVYPGSLDPITFGHIDAIKATAESFGTVQVAIGVNLSKKYMFALAEREALAKKALFNVNGASVTSFSGLLVHFLVRNNYGVVVRGLRNGQDLGDAMTQDTIGWQQQLADKINAFYVPSRPGQTFTSSTALKAVIKEQGDATALAPACTIHATQARMLGQYFYGVTGISGSGKSTLCKKFKEIAQRRHIPLCHVDLDDIGHRILSEEDEPLYQATRQEIGRKFGGEVIDEGGVINRKKLGERVFGDPDNLKALNKILHEPIFFRMNDILRGQKGVFLIDAALLPEADRTALVHHQLLMVKASQKNISERLATRDKLSPDQIERRMNSQFTEENKIAAIKGKIAASGYGGLDFLNNDGSPDKGMEEAFEQMLRQVDIHGELRITSFLKSIGVENASEAYGAIQKLYSGNDRFHHALAHIVDGLDQIPEFSKELQDKDAFTLGWVFHDSVYDTRKIDNEEMSAATLQKMCASWGIGEDLIRRAQEFVMVTKHGAIKPETRDEELMVDMDMSIIGAPAETYENYRTNVRREYGWASKNDWAKGRGDFLGGLKRPFFLTSRFGERLAAQAEANIRRELSELI